MEGSGIESLFLQECKEEILEPVLQPSNGGGSQDVKGNRESKNEDHFGMKQVSMVDTSGGGDEPEAEEGFRLRSSFCPLRGQLS